MLYLTKPFYKGLWSRRFHSNLNHLSLRILSLIPTPPPGMELYVQFFHSTHLSPGIPNLNSTPSIWISISNFITLPTSPLVYHVWSQPPPYGAWCPILSFYPPLPWPFWVPVQWRDIGLWPVELWSLVRHLLWLLFLRSPLLPRLFQLLLLLHKLQTLSKIMIYNTIFANHVL